MLTLQSLQNEIPSYTEISITRTQSALKSIVRSQVRSTLQSPIHRLITATFIQASPTTSQVVFPSSTLSPAGEKMKKLKTGKMTCISNGTIHPREPERKPEYPEKVYDIRKTVD